MPVVRPRGRRPGPTGIRQLGWQLSVRCQDAQAKREVSRRDAGGLVGVREHAETVRGAGPDSHFASKASPFGPGVSALVRAITRRGIGLCCGGWRIGNLWLIQGLEVVGCDIAGRCRFQEVGRAGRVSRVR